MNRRHCSIERERTGPMTFFPFMTRKKSILYLYSSFECNENPLKTAYNELCEHSFGFLWPTIYKTNCLLWWTTINKMRNREKKHIFWLVYIYLLTKSMCMNVNAMQSVVVVSTLIDRRMSIRIHNNHNNLFKLWQY